MSWPHAHPGPLPWDRETLCHRASSALNHGLNPALELLIGRSLFLRWDRIYLRRGKVRERVEHEIGSEEECGEQNWKCR